MLIYKTINKINGKIYVGQTTKGEEVDYIGSGNILKHAIKKYGRENFKREIICKCRSIKRLNEMEKYWIKKLKSQDKKIGYNITAGGEFNPHGKYNGHYGNARSKETIKKISEAELGNKNHFFGKKHTKSSRLKMSIMKKLHTKYVYHFIDTKGKAYNNIQNLQTFISKYGMNQNQIKFKNRQFVEYKGWKIIRTNKNGKR